MRVRYRAIILYRVTSRTALAKECIYSQEGDYREERSHVGASTRVDERAEINAKSPTSIEALD